MSTSGVKSVLCLGLLTCLVWATAFPPEAFALEVVVKEKAVVQGDMILLGHIASFHPADEPRVARLRMIEVGAAPPPGRTATLSSRYMVYKLSKAISAEEAITVKMPQDLHVQRDARIVTAHELEQIFRDYILSHAPWPDDKVHFERISTPQAVSLPCGHVSWEVREGDTRDFVGDVSVLVSFMVDGKRIRKISIHGRVRLEQACVQTTRAIRAGDTLEKGDVILVTETVTRLRKDAFTKEDDVIGKRARRGLQEGQVVTPDVIESPPLVKRGMRVIIRAENERLEVVTVGKVLENGAAGDQVKVMNIQSGKEILATVIGPGKVSVHF